MKRNLENALTLTPKQEKAITSLLDEKGLILYTDWVIRCLNKVPLAYYAVSSLLTRPSIAGSETDTLMKTLETVSDLKEYISKIGNSPQTFTAATELAFYLGGEKEELSEILTKIKGYKPETQQYILEYSLLWPRSHGQFESVHNGKPIYADSITELIDDLVQEYRTDEEVYKFIISRISKMREDYIISKEYQF